jgi:hypothetical protein
MTFLFLLALFSKRSSLTAISEEDAIDDVNPLYLALIPTNNIDKYQPIATIQKCQWT